MKITPLEIRQKVFEKTLRGYNKEDVGIFLNTLSIEWERMQSEMRELTIRLTVAEKEMAKLREVENSLYKTLKTAEDTGANVMDQANKQAELELKEARLKADEVMSNAKKKAQATVESSEAISKRTLNDMETQLQHLIQNYKNMTIIKNGLVDDLKRVADETLQKIDRIKNDMHDFDTSEYLIQTKRTIDKTNHQDDLETTPSDVTTKNDARSFNDTKEVQKPKNEIAKSFFDDI